MSMRLRFSILSVAFLAVVSAAGRSGTVAGAPPGLARLVPADARIYLEVRDWSGLTGGPTATLLADLLQSFAPAATQPAGSQPAATLSGTTQPASAPPAWRDRLAAHVGLTQPGILDQILSGKLALACDGWNDWGEAVLVAQPAKPAELERILATVTSAPSDSHIRCFALTNDHELAFDGSNLVVGRRAGASSLFERTLTLWSSRHGVALSDTADFQARIKHLPARCQILAYVTGRTRSGQGAALPTLLWPAAWNQFQSLGATMSISAGGITLETSVSPEQGGSSGPSAASPLLRQLPASTLAAWSASVDYAAQYHRLSSLKAERLVAFYRGVLENGLPPHSIDHALLAHLKGETLFVVSRLARPTATSPGDEHPPLWIPALTMAVSTPQPDAVTATLERVFQNLAMLLNIQPAPSGPLRVERVPIGPGGGTIQILAAGQRLRVRPGREILGQLQLSWTVADGLLVVGTAAEGVREVVLARRGQTPLLAPPADAPHDSLASSRTVLVAQPLLISDLLASWAQSFAAEPALLVQSDDWWAQLQSVRAVSLYQLGAIPGQTARGAVQVAFVLPGLPAAGRLRAGDMIVAVENQSLDSADALAAVDMLLAARARPDVVVFKVIRDGCEESVELPIPPPPAVPRPSGAVEFLQQASRVLRLFARTRYSTRSPETGVQIARLDLEFVAATASR